MPQINFQYIGRCQERYLQSGTYLFEVWGAQGGTCGVTESGRGGYAKGTGHFRTQKRIVVCVGGKGNYSDTSITAGGFNGGGQGVAGQSIYNSCGGSGGGATDIRLGDDYTDRIIVAGGGGGYSSYTIESIYSNGGFGGGYEGGTAGTIQEYGRGATREGPGNGGKYQNSNLHCNANPGTIDGKGGDACSVASAGAGGGGGGYYGGGGGGSGFIDSSLQHHTLLAADTLFLSPTGILEKGHPGDGYARITLLSNKCTLPRNSFRLTSLAYFFVTLS